MNLNHVGWWFFIPYSFLPQVSYHHVDSSMRNQNPNISGSDSFLTPFSFNFFNLGSMVCLARFGEMVRSLEKLAWDCERGSGWEQVGICLWSLGSPPSPKGISSEARLMLQWGTWEELVLVFWVNNELCPFDTFSLLASRFGLNQTPSLLDLLLKP